MILLGCDATRTVQKRTFYGFFSECGYKLTVLPSQKRSGLGVVLLIWLAGVLLPTTAWGQAGLYVRPALSIAQYYDDNVFRSISNKKSDFVTRPGAWIQGGYESAPLQLLGHYGFASEIFAKNSQLTKALSLQDAGVDFLYLPTRRWTLGLSGGYVQTHQPESINVPTGILGERTKSRNYSASPSLSHQWSALTTLSSFYLFNRNEQDGGARTDSQTANFEIDRRITELDTLAFAYTLRRFDSSSGGEDEALDEIIDEDGDQTAHVATIGWTRQISPLTAFALRIGPRFTEGRVTPEVLASVWRALPYWLGSITLTYERTQRSLVGRGGPVNTDSVILSWAQQLARHLFLNASPAFYNNTGSDFETQVYRFDVNATYIINKWLAFRSSYQINFENGDVLGFGSLSRGERSRNMVLFELVAASPFRVL